MRRRSIGPDGTVRIAFGRALRHARLRADLTAAELGQIVHVSGRTVLAYETGECNPDRPDTVEELDRALGTGGLLRGLYEDVLAERARRSTAHMPVPDGADEGADVRRRALLGLIGGVAVLGPLADRLEELRISGEDVIDSPTTSRDLDEWERVAWDYACMVGSVPGPSLISDLALDFAEVERLVRDAAGAVRKGLLHVMGQLAALMAISLVGVGDQRAARRWWRTAARAADRAGELDLAAIVRGRQAVLALYDDRPHSSVIELAEEGIAAGRGAPRAGVLSSHAAIAQANADLGRHEDALASLHDLENLFDRLPASVVDEEDSQWGWPEKRLRHVESYVFTRAGDLVRAQEAQDRALSLYPEASYQGRAQVEMHRAAAVIVGGDPTEGVKHALRVLQQLPADHRNDALVVRSASDALAMAPASGEASKFAGQARDLLGITADGR